MVHGAANDQVAAAAEVAEALRRAGVRASAAQIERLVEGYVLMQQGLAALRQRLEGVTEPAAVFNSAEAARARGGSDGR